MLGTPVDAQYTWLGLSLASLAMFAAAAGVPTAAAPDAAAAANTVDAVAAAPHDSRASHPTRATALRADDAALTLRGDGGTVSAPLSYGPVVGVRDDTALAAVLAGAPPASVFASPDALADAVAAARNRNAGWTRVDDRLVARHVTWGDVRVTLVGA